ncbi:MAG: glycosyltransferase family 9 protein [Candidatus Zixiibacteriota bacterium]
MLILVIRFSSLGDVVLAGAAVRALVRAHPEAQVVLATKAEYAVLYDHYDLPLTVAGYDHRQGWRSFTAQWSGVVFDRVIDLHRSWRSGSLNRRVKSRLVTKVDKQFSRRLGMVWRKRGLERPLSTLAGYLEAVRFPGGPPLAGKPRLCLSAGEQECAHALRQKWPRALGIGWGARHPTKAVPPEQWARLVLGLEPGSLDAVRIFGMESDRRDIEPFMAALGERIPAIDFASRCGLSLRDAMVEIAALSAFASSDSGLMHVAAALGVPTFGLFGPTHPSLGFAPLGPGSAAFHAGTWCSPCHRHGKAPCYRERRFCFEELDMGKIGRTIAPHLASGPEVASR